VQRLAQLISDYKGRLGTDATRTAIAAVRVVADWVYECTADNPVYELLDEADRAAAELEGRADG
jgi:hypothetical protein